MIEFRTVRDELDRFDELHKARFCPCCADSPEAQESELRRVFERAAAKGNSSFLRCANCAARWTPAPDIDSAVRGWFMILSDDRLVGTLCGACKATNPDPIRLPSIARLVLEGSRGTLQ